MLKFVKIKNDEINNILSSEYYKDSKKILIDFSQLYSDDDVLHALDEAISIPLWGPEIIIGVDPDPIVKPQTTKWRFNNSCI